MHRVASEILARAALPLIGVSQRCDSSFGRCRAAAEGVLRGEDEKCLSENDESGGEGRGSLRAVLNWETRCVLSPVYKLHLRRVQNDAQEAKGVSRPSSNETLEELKKGGAKFVSLKESLPPKCLEHDKTMKMFCFNCDCPICRDCTLIDHNRHSYNFLKKCATETRKTLRDLHTPLKRV